MCDPERMIATPESDAEFKARVEQERRAARGAHGWLHSLGFGGGGSSNDGESSKGDGASHIGEKVGCVVLTVGVDIANSRGGFAFERDMRALYGCEVHVFDAMAGATPPDTADADAFDAFDEDGVGGGGAEKKPRAAAGGSMTFTAGVSLASTSTAPTAVTAQTGKRRRAAPLDDDDDEDEEEDEEFRGESGDDDDAGAKRPLVGRRRRRRRRRRRDAPSQADDAFGLPLRRRLPPVDRRKRLAGDDLFHDPAGDDRRGDARVGEQEEGRNRRPPRARRRRPHRVRRVRAGRADDARRV